MLTCAASARAGEMDPAPERLVMPATDPANPPTIVTPDQMAFRNLVAEYGSVIAPNAFHPARTTGFGGFALTIEGSFSAINTDAKTPGSETQFWHKGTVGRADGTAENQSPAPVMQLYSLRARKGLPLGFEVTTALGYLTGTSLGVTGADLRWSLLEGFRSGFLGAMPDISVGGGIRTLVGSTKLFLTAVGVDTQISKPFAIAGTVQFTPWIGYQRLYIFGNSTVLDFTPNVDPFKQCGYIGPSASGAPNCANQQTDPRTNTLRPADDDFNNNKSFDAVVIHRHRGILGASVRYEVFYSAAQFLMDLTDPSDENKGLSGSKQWTTSVEAGVFF